MGEGYEERPAQSSSETGIDVLPPSGEDFLDVWLSYKPGDVIAERYLLVKKLDQGGMGVVWVAHHIGLDVHVALKLVRPGSDAPEAAERLVREAQAAARVVHPAIVQVHDVGRTREGDPFLVMELLEGELLGDVLYREKRLPVDTALRVLLPIAGALAAMHAKGILHRDVKPDNIFLAHDDTGRWQPKLIDFGLARLDTPSLMPITMKGMIVGTPVYLSPERIWGEEADPRDDVWSLAVALYEMVTGAVPFEGEHPAQVLLAAKAGDPPPIASHGVEDPEVWAIVKRGLCRRRDRWGSVREMGEAIARLLWRRGVTEDIAGAALRPSWVDGFPPPPAHPPSASAAQDTAPPISRGSLPPDSGVTGKTVPFGRPGGLVRPVAMGAPPASLPAQPSRPAQAPEPPLAKRRDSSELSASFAVEPLIPRPVVWIAAGALALVALGVGVFVVRRGDPASAPRANDVPAAVSVAPAPVVPAAETSRAAAPGTSAPLTPEPPALPSPSAQSAPPRTRGAGGPPQSPGAGARHPTQDLKDPFH